jgi:DNA-binding XRE family transcriptional regulator
MDEKNRIQFYLWMHEMKGIDLAQKAGLSQASVSNARKRNMASTKTRKQIAEAFGAPVEEVFPNGTIELKERRKPRK